jgi:DNA-binding IclR family transcriptional regulator
MDRVERITSIIGLMAYRKTPWRVTELGSELKIEKSSISRILASLEKKQWVKKLPNEEYVLGDRMLELSLSVLSGTDIRRVSLPYLYELNSETRETAGLTIRVDFEDIVIDQVESQNSVRHVLGLGIRYPLWSGATGKAILANMEESEIEAFCSSLKKAGDLILASGVKLNIDKLREELVIVRKQGYAMSLGERTPITSAVAAPIFERNNVTGAILATGPLPRFDELVAKKCSGFVIQAARNISLRLGSSL